MTTNLSPNIDEKQQVTRAVRATAVLTGGAFLLAFISFFEDYSSPEPFPRDWHELAGTPLLFGFAIICLISFTQVRRGRVLQAGRIILVSLFGMGIAGSIIQADIGLVIGLTVFILTAQIAAQMSLPTRETRWFIVASIIVGILAFLLDVFEVGGRLHTSEYFRNVLTVSVILLAFLYSVFSLRQFRDYSLQTKLIIAFVGVALIAVGAVSFVADRTIRSSLTTNVGSSLKVLADNKALAIASLMDREVDLLQTFALSKHLQDEVAKVDAYYVGDAAAIKQEIDQSALMWTTARNDTPLVRGVLVNTVASELNALRDKFPDNAELFVTDKYGAVIGATSRVENYYYGDQMWWAFAYSTGRGDIFIEQPEFNPNLKSFGINIAMPIYGHASDQVVGVLHVTYRAQAITDTLAAARFGKTGNARLLISQDQLLTSEGTLEAMPSDEYKALDATRDLDYVEVDYQKGQRLVSQATVATTDTSKSPYIKKLGWRLIVDQDRNEALGVVDTAARASSIAGLSTLLVAALLAVATARLLTGPIARLTETAVKITSGDLTARAQVEATDEIGTLAMTFNSMTGQLRHTLEGLEERVVERTHELADANTSLQKNNQYLAALQETSLGLIGRLNLNELLEAIVARAGELVGTENGYVYLLESAVSATGTQGEMQMRVGIGVYSILVGSYTKQGIGLAGTVWETGAPVAVEDYRTWSRRLKSAGRDVLRAVVGVPLKSGEQVTGVIGLARLEEGRIFTPDEIQVLNQFAALASVALENARLFEETQAALAQTRQLAHREQTRAAIADRLHTTIDMEGILRIAAEELRRTTGSARAVIRLGQKATVTAQRDEETN